MAAYKQPDNQAVADSFGLVSAGLKSLAEKYGIRIEFLFHPITGQPIANFIGGTDEQQLQLAMEVDKNFGNICD